MSCGKQKNDAKEKTELVGGVTIPDNVNRGCEFGDYKGLSYRVCYGLTKDGKMDYSRPLYEFSKYCKCSNCERRLKMKRGTPNRLSVTTDDKNRFQEAFEVINAYTCNCDESKPYEYVRIEKEL